MHTLVFIAFLLVPVLFVLNANSILNGEDQVFDERDPKRQWKFLFFTEQCFDKIIYEFDFSWRCFQFTLSKFMGIGIVVISLVHNMPQIYKIWHHKSVEGLSFMSFYFGLYKNIFNITYNIHINSPFTLWGEKAFKLVQKMIIVEFIYIYGNISSWKFFFYIVVFIGIAASMILQMFPDEVYQAAITISIMLIFLSKIPQIWLNYKNKSTGVQACFTVGWHFFGPCARLFTVYTENPDFLLLVYHSTSAVLNLILLVQFYIYNRNKRIYYTEEEIDEVQPPNNTPENSITHKEN